MILGRVPAAGWHRASAHRGSRGGRRTPSSDSDVHSGLSYAGAPGPAVLVGRLLGAASCQCQWRGAAFPRNRC
jgi:hypothetical protein